MEKILVVAAHPVSAMMPVQTHAQADQENR